MEIVITGSAFDTGVSIKNHIKEKLDLVAKKLKDGKLHKIHAVLNKESINFVCKIDVMEEIGGKSIIHASYEATDAYACVDLAIKRIEEQVVRYKDKIITDRNHEGAVFKEKSRHLPEAEIVDEEYEVLGENEADDEFDETLKKQ
jgi:ribosomal subunit interface protein